MADLFFYFKVEKVMQVIQEHEYIRTVFSSKLSHWWEEQHWMRMRCTWALVPRRAFLTFQEKDSGEKTSGLLIYQRFPQDDLSPTQSAFSTRKTGLWSFLR